MSSLRQVAHIWPGLVTVTIALCIFASPSADARDSVGQPLRSVAPQKGAMDKLGADPSGVKASSEETPSASFAMLPLVLRQPTPTPTLTPSPTPEPLWVTPGGWAGPQIDLTVSADGHYLERAAGYTPCGWVSWHGREAIGWDGAFRVTATGGAIEGTFTSASRCEGVTDGWSVDGQVWCREQVAWVAAPR
ncbi:MAG: hypothetical protein JXA74_16430 [Anaerolineae bacterium]|nr:hypothetical protein [Anaerolineae bacterium]